MQKWPIFLCLFLLSACADSAEEISKQFQNNDQITVLDLNTELMWAAADSQQSFTWQEAVDYCEAYSAGGYEDWRMPTRAELSALFAAGINKEGKMISISGERIWAIEGDDTKGAFCHFTRGGCSWGEKVMSITLRALPVRDTMDSIADDTQSTAARSQTVEQRLQILDSLYRQKLLTDDEYSSKRAAILDEL